ncbi:MAG: PD40 domain-containing protein [Bacteroidetes bacterium]|nr:PD40 domain-containing protein [Bacteroidota bacterium]
MKNITKVTLTAVAALTISFSAFSQKALEKADLAFENHQYYDAVTLYKSAYQKAPADKKGTIMFRAGYASQKINDYKGAESYYQKAISVNYDDPIVYYRLAQVLKCQQKYDEAIVEFNNYKNKRGDAKKADLGVKSCQLAQQWTDNPLRYKVENMSMINTKQRDYSPCFADKKYQLLNFASTRDGSTGDIDMVTGSNHSDIWQSKVDKNGKWSTPVLLPPTISTPVNEGQPWVSKKGDMIFFTRCPEEKGKTNVCGLYMAKKQGSTWGEAVKLPFSNDTVQFVHPSLSADGKILYFSSKMKGGYGSYDIWSCTYDAKSNAWGQPKNLGPSVNTEGIEAYPTVSNDGKKLYFSSDYHPGMGGLDIFVAEPDASGKFTKPVENMKAPINSSYDDFGIIFEGKKLKGYFTSNREGGKGDDDIWSFYLPPMTFNLKGSVFNCGDENTGKGQGEPVEGVKVKLIGSNGSIEEVTTAKNGNYTFKLKEATTYTVSTETSKSSKSVSFPKDGFLSTKDVRVVTTVGEDKSKDFQADFCVKPVVPVLRMPKVLFELGKATLTPAGKDSLNYLFDILKDNPGIVVELSAHTDNQGDAKANMKLSDERAATSRNFLVSEKGINEKRIMAKGLGATQLLIPDDLIKKAASKEERDALHEKNRRVEFKVLNFDFVDPNAPKAPTKPKKAADDEEEDEE